jgi:hypothetical protein
MKRILLAAVALALMADRALAAEPQMPESFQGIWCYNKTPIPTGVPTAAAIRTILGGIGPGCGINYDHPDPDPELEIEITATTVKTRAFADRTHLELIPAIPVSCVVRRVTKSDSKVVSDKPVGTRLSHRAPMRWHPQAVGDDRDRLADRKGIHPRGRCAARLSMSVG